MSLVEINWRPEAGELRKFGLAMIAGFGVMGLFFYLRDVHSATWVDWSIGTLPMALWIGGGLAGLLGLSGRKAGLPVYWTWMGIAFVMGNIVSRVFLMLLYYGLVTPMGFFMRLSGRDKLMLRRREVGSYWCDVPPLKHESPYHRQF